MKCRFVGGCVDGQRSEVGHAPERMIRQTGSMETFQVSGYRRCRLQLEGASVFVYAEESLGPEAILGKLG